MNLRNKLPKFTVTIVTGLICKNGIVLASDSRTTEDDYTIRDDTQKIYPVQLAGFDSFLVATAGHAGIARRTIGVLARRAKDTPLTDYRTVADLAEASVTEVKNILRDQFKGTSAELQQHFRDYHFELLLAYYFQGRPFLYSLVFELGLATLCKPCTAIGCGRLLAEFCLQGVNVSESYQQEACVTAVYAVEQVKKFDPRCGGAVQIGVSWAQANEEGPAHSTHAVLQQPGYVKLIVDQITAISEETDARWKSQISHALIGVNTALAGILKKFTEDNPNL